MVYLLGPELEFPPPQLADENGLLALGGDLSVDRLLLAYRQGIFPWYEEGLPILWHSPDPRMLMTPADLYVGRTTRKALRKRPYRFTIDTAFPQVISACAESPRSDQDGTWITEDIKTGYTQLHTRGFAHSAECWLGDDLVGGLYGVSLGTAFFGESMFSRADNASKIAFILFVAHLQQWGIELIDCQVHTELFEGFGARLRPRTEYLRRLADCVRQPTRMGPWSQDPDIVERAIG